MRFVLFFGIFELRIFFTGIFEIRFVLFFRIAKEAEKGDDLEGVEMHIEFGKIGVVSCSLTHSRLVPVSPRFSSERVKFVLPKYCFLTRSPLVSPAHTNRCNFPRYLIAVPSPPYLNSFL